MAKRGYSLDQRPDCKQVCIGLVVTREGFPSGYEVFDGNRTDGTTVEDIVETMETRYGKADRVWVMDRGIDERRKPSVASGGRAQVRNWDAEIRASKVRTRARRARRLETDTRRCRGQALPRSGRRRDFHSLPLGRSNITDGSAEELWNLYVQLTEAEAAFRIQKSELKIRPVWHHKKDRTKAHILVCFLAYAMWKTLAGWQKKAGLGSSPRTVLEEFQRIQSTDVILPLENGEDLRLRCVVQPDDAQKTLLDHLGLTLPQRLLPSDANGTM